MGNFHFLQIRWPELYEQAAKAEISVHAETEITAIRLRCFGELVVRILFQAKGLRLPPNGSQFENLKCLEEMAVVDREVLRKLHALRISGNKAAHAGSISLEQAANLLLDAFSLAQWFWLLMAPDESQNFSPFNLPDQPHEKNQVNGESLEIQLAETERQLAAFRQEVAVENPPNALPEDEDRLKSTSIEALNKLDPKLRALKSNFNLEDVFVEEELTAGQENLISELQRFLDDRGSKVFLLTGYAGTGKTFITKGLTEYLRSQGRAFRVAAPTGRAAKVISAKSGCDAHTLHRQIYDFEKLVEYKDDGLDGSETFKNYAQIKVNDLPANAVFIVDEASLFSDVYQEGEFFRSGSGYLLKDFLQFVGLDHNDHDKKVIFIGDTAQLPPVDMAFSPALDASYLRKTYGVLTCGCELTDVVRQKADSGVMRNVQPLRESIASAVFNHLTIDFGSPEVAKVTTEDLLPTYLESCDHAVNGKSVIITRSNADAAEFNRAVRQHFFPEKGEVTAGDKLMVVANTRIDGHFISNGDFIWVKEAAQETETRNVTLKRKHPDTQVIESITVVLAFREVQAGIRDTEGKPFFFTTRILENLLYDNNPSLSSDEQKALYIDFCMRHEFLKRGDAMFRKTLLADPYFNAMRVKFGYAITCHKAQGSEWEHVFVNCHTALKPLSEDNFRWLYTAMTRTTNWLYLLYPPNLPIGTGVKPISPTPIPKSRRPTTWTPQEVVDAPLAPTGSGSKTTPPMLTFGMTKQDGLPFSILMRVQSILATSGVEIEDIAHNQYQEAYFFRRGDVAARVNIAYNGRGKVAGVVASQKDPLSDELARLLEPLIGHQVLTVLEEEKVFTFGEPFLNEYHARLTSLALEHQISVADVAPRDYCQRYTFSRDSEVAVVDIFYTSKSVFTRCQPISNRSTPGQLLHDVIDVLTNGMSA